jgi:3-oxoacyl-(acyl-carrier-protein) synthase
MLDALAQGMREVRSKPVVGEQLQVGHSLGAARAADCGSSALQLLRGCLPLSCACG